MKTKLRMGYLSSIPLFIVALSCSVMFFAAAGAEAASDPTSSQDSAQAPEFKAAEEAAQRYMAAYNKGDAKTLASFFAEDVDYIDEDGAEVKGREAIQKLKKAIQCGLKQSKGAIRPVQARFDSGTRPDRGG